MTFDSSRGGCCEPSTVSVSDKNRLDSIREQQGQIKLVFLRERWIARGANWRERRQYGLDVVLRHVALAHPLRRPAAVSLSDIRILFLLNGGGTG